MSTCIFHVKRDRLSFQIAASMDDVASRLKRIEGCVGGERSVSFGGGSFRRKSSFGRSTRSRIQSSANLSPLPSVLTPPEGSSRNSLESQRLLDAPGVDDDYMQEEPSSEVII